jgi:hypothetical protein
MAGNGELVAVSAVVGTEPVPFNPQAASSHTKMNKIRDE